MEFDSCANRHLFRIVYENFDLSISSPNLPYEKSLEVGPLCCHGFCHSRYYSYYSVSLGSVFTSPETLGADYARKLLVISDRR